MATNKKNNDFEKPDVDEEYLMNIISGDEPETKPNPKKQETPKETKPRERVRNSPSKKVDYEEAFLVNRFPSGRHRQHRPHGVRTGATHVERQPTRLFFPSHPLQRKP